MKKTQTTKTEVKLNPNRIDAKTMEDSIFQIDKTKGRDNCIMTVCKPAIPPAQPKDYIAKTHIEGRK